MPKDWLSLAKNAYESSTSYVDANYRKKWDDSIRMFQSRHPSDSKYNTDTYKHRSKLFRPKTRSLVRKHEAALAAAVFSNLDVISTAPVNEDSREEKASSDVMKEILQYRLTKSIPWFKIVCGGMQDAMTIGVVCSYQYWKFKEIDGESTYEPVMDEFGQPVLDEEGQLQVREIKNKQVVDDKPCVELIPVENLRIDPGADWLDPVASSPYLIRMIPMYVTDVKSLMEDGDEETGKNWKKLDDGQIRSAMKQENDQTRQTREQNRQDSTDTGNAPITDYEIVWVHENFVRAEGEEMVFFTLGVEYLLTDPVPLKEAYFTGERPIVIGSCVLETHKAFPESPVMMAENLQREVNEIANQRIDNVKMVLNKRYFAKRGAQIDLKSIVRNVPGSVTLMNDPVGDVRTVDFQDVTSSSYAEQDRLNVDYDELTGNFSQGSVMTNRKMGETVGGMGMVSQAANQITEYTIRTFIETWLEPVLRQLVKLEQKYETDEVVLALAAGKAKIFQKYGISQVTDELLNKELTLTVNVGMGATDPVLKLNKFVSALGSYANVAQMQLPNMDMEEIGKEIFALAGYRDGARFSNNSEEGQKIQQVIQQAQGMVQQAQQELGQKEQQVQQEAMKVEQDKIAVERMGLNVEKQIMSSQTPVDNSQAFIEQEKMRQEYALAQYKIDKEQETALMKARIEQQSKEDIAEMDAWVEIQKAKIQADSKEDEKEAMASEIKVEEMPKIMRRKITIQAPSGGIYTGMVEGE